MPYADPEKRREARRRHREKYPEARREQKRRARERKGSIPRSTTHCRRGHEFSPENTYTYPDGSRHCKACKEIKRLERRALLPPAVKRTRRTSEETAAASRKRGLEQKGWTPEMLSATLIEQGNRCAICRLPMSRPCADHAHTEPPEPRGVLCDGCNTAIGLLRESPERCRAASEYLEAWS